MPGNIRIGTRGSDLALRQTNHVKTLLENLFPGIVIDIETIKTTGDKILDSPLAKIGNKGLFIKELEEALLDERIDIAVHSFKDIPTVIPEDLIIAAVLEREDAHDVFISHPKNTHQLFNSLPRSAIIATGSLRRRCQILKIRQDIQIVDIRGNINTRLKKLDESNWNGIILAKAGITRLGHTQLVTEILPYEIMLPAVGQGALAVEVRNHDTRVKDLLLSLHHIPTALSVAAERSLLRHLEGGCQIPIGAFGQIQGNDLHLDAVIGSLDGIRIVKGNRTGNHADAERIGIELAEELLNRGGREILDEIRETSDI